MIDILHIDDDDMAFSSHFLHSRVSRALIALSFPSDSISVKHLRTHFPERFDIESRNGDVFGNYFLVDWAQDPLEHDSATKHLRELGDLLSCERALAAHLLAEADGKTSSSDDLMDKEAAKKLLVKYYQNLKLSEGEADAMKLVDKIQSNVKDYVESQVRAR